MYKFALILDQIMSQELTVHALGLESVILLIHKHLVMSCVSITNTWQHSYEFIRYEN